MTTTRSTRPARREWSALAWWAGLLALGVLVLLTVNVVRHLTASPTPHHHLSNTLFRQGAATTLGPLLSHRLLTVWQLDVVAVVVLVVAAAWYLTRVGRLARRGRRWPVYRTVGFLAGLAVCAYATCGPVAVYDQALFSAHMLGHLALVMVAPALLAVGSPLRLAVDSSRPGTGERIVRVLHSRVASVLTSPPVALACYAAVIVGSHLTGLMDTIMQTTWAGQVEHLVYLAVGYQFFALVIGDDPLRWRLSTPARWIMLALSMAVDTFTGIVLMMAVDPIAMTPAPGLSVDALADTHTGGAIMWAGGDALMALVMIVLVVGWLRRSGREADDRTSWLEQARFATLDERTGATVASAADVDPDADEARLAAYNAWLARLHGAGAPPPR